MLAKNIHVKYVQKQNVLFVNIRLRKKSSGLLKMFHSIKNIIVICRFLLHFVIPTKEESLCCKDSSFHFVPFRMTSVRYYINCIFLQISVHLWQKLKHYKLLSLPVKHNIIGIKKAIKNAFVNQVFCGVVIKVLVFKQHNVMT